MVKLSDNLRAVQTKQSTLQLRFDPEDKEFGFPWYWHGLGIILVFFDPWNGNLLRTSFIEFLNNIDDNSKVRFNKQIKEKHKNGICRDLSYYIDDGVDTGMTSIIHVPNIRTYAILNKKEYGGFEGMDFCPFCGARFPERLDKKLTEILQAEYGLQSWRDYKKAPHEFHTDDWWKKRGL